MKIGVKILPRNEVLDTQGRAVERTLKHNAREISSCRVGKYVVLDINENDPSKAMNQAREISQFVLHNPLIETFELEVLNK